jgi:hypothetical protein
MNAVPNWGRLESGRKKVGSNWGGHGAVANDSIFPLGELDSTRASLRNIRS